MELKERIEKADAYADVCKKKLEVLIKQYSQSKESYSPDDMLNCKDEFIAMEYDLGNAAVLARELSGRAEQDAKMKFNLAYIDEKQNYEDGKKPTNEYCGIQARLKTSDETILEIQIDAVYRQFQHFQGVCTNYITQISQRIKGLQQEWINSNQSNG